MNEPSQQKLKIYNEPKQSQLNQKEFQYHENTYIIKEHRYDRKSEDK